MGDAGCASSSNAWSNYWNPAKNVLSEKKNGIGFSYIPWLRALVPDINLVTASLYKKIGKKNAFGLSGSYFSLGDITFTDIVGNTIGQFRPLEYYISASYSRMLSKKFSLAISSKYIHSNLTGNLSIAGSQSHHGESFS